MRLKNKVAIITGGSRRIGFATANAFLREGAAVIVAASTQASANRAAASLRELHPAATVNAVAPGIIETDMMKASPREVIEPLIARIPLKRLGQPEDIANAFIFLASDEAAYITGVIPSVDGIVRT